MGSSFEKIVGQGQKTKTALELAASPPDILTGVSEADAQSLSEALGIETIRDLATNRFVRAAGAVTAAADAVPGYDPGPPSSWEDVFAGAPLATYEGRPDLFRLDFGPVFYRGRLDGTARVLVVGQDPSVNEILAHRVFVGRSGQRLQGFLGKLAINRSYLMLNTFLYSIFGQFGDDNETLSHQDPILSYRNSQFDKAADENSLRAVVTVGTGAREAVDRWPGSGSLTRVHVLHPAFPNESQLLQNWNTGLTELRAIVEADDGANPGPDYGNAFVTEDIVPIPRWDLPFGLPGWHGDGDHGKRDGDRIIEWRRDAVT
jgi:uracil-DNA glycosylase